VNTEWNGGAETREAFGAEKRLKELGITLSTPPQPFGTYVEAVQTGNLRLLSGMQSHRPGRRRWRTERKPQ